MAVSEGIWWLQLWFACRRTRLLFRTLRPQATFENNLKICNERTEKFREIQRLIFTQRESSPKLRDPDLNRPISESNILQLFLRKVFFETYTRRLVKYRTQVRGIHADVFKISTKHWRQVYCSRICLAQKVVDLYFSNSFGSRKMRNRLLWCRSHSHQQLPSHFAWLRWCWIDLISELITLCRRLYVAVDSYYFDISSSREFELEVWYF